MAKTATTFSAIFLSCLVGLALCLFSVGCDRKQGIEKPEQEAPAVLREKKEEFSLAIEAQTERDTIQKSLDAEATGKIGDAQLRIVYHSPAVRGRVIWGALVPYRKVWAAGDHSATRLETDKPLKVGGKLLPAGKYGLFMVPSQGDWIIILNKDWNQHLTTEYAARKDQLRVTLKPEKVNVNQERLRYEIITQRSNAGELVFTWERIKLVLPISQ